MAVPLWGGVVGTWLGLSIVRTWTMKGVGSYIHISRFREGNTHIHHAPRPDVPIG